MRSLVERLRCRCRIEPATECWIWTQAKCGGGHPMIEIAEFGRVMNVRRLMYLIACGPITKGRVVSTGSTCGEKDCINPKHLRSIGRAELNRKNSASRRVRRSPLKLPQAVWHPVPA